jgi:predicted TPR repeat methyltransferase
MNTLRDAIEAHKGGRFGEAEAAYRHILQADPDNPDALNFLGMLKCQAGEPGAAAPLLRHAVAADPTNPHAWLNLGNVLLVSGAEQDGRAALEKATELAPDLPIAWFNLGVCLGRCRRPHEAASALHRALKLEPGYLPAYESLATVLHFLGDYAEAAELYREWLVYDPHNPIPAHMLAAATGHEVPARATDEFVRRVFDAFAASFDDNLKALDYRAPEWIAERLGREHPADASLDILDAGCGTGLCGPLLRGMARRLVGVDISPAMLEKARVRAAYDELAVGELAQFMRSNARRFDSIVSADTLVYFGALEDVFTAAHTALRGAGSLTFTLERLDEASPGLSHRLETHGRYTHSEDYVRSALAHAGFAASTFETRALRWERGAEVAGHLVWARASS